MKKILIILGSIIVIGCLLWFGLTYWIGGSIGGGGMQQYAPDTVEAGEPADVTLIVTATGGGGNIQGRFTNLMLHYRLVGENAYKSIQPQSITLPDNFKTVQSKTFQSEAYKFAIPAYPKGTVGEIEYYTEMTFDGYPSKTDGVKKIKLGTDISRPTPVSADTEKEINPDNYTSITIEKNKSNYVRSRGAIKILFSQSATISFSIEKVNSPNTVFNNSPLPFVVYTNESTMPKDPNNNYVYGKYGDFSYMFTAPEIPGTYNIVFSEPELNSQKITDVVSKYEITVVGKVDNELLASRIVDRAIFAKLNEANPKNWKIASQEVKSIGNAWDVFMQINYNSCGIDWDDTVCTAKIVKGHYVIDKSSGIVTEITL